MKTLESNSHTLNIYYVYPVGTKSAYDCLDIYYVYPVGTKTAYDWLDIVLRQRKQHPAMTAAYAPCS